MGHQFQLSSCILVQSVIGASHLAQDTGRNTRAICRKAVKNKDNCSQARVTAGTGRDMKALTPAGPGNCSKDRMGLWTEGPHSKRRSSSLGIMIITETGLSSLDFSM